MPGKDGDTRVSTGAGKQLVARSTDYKKMGTTWAGFRGLTKTAPRKAQQMLNRLYKKEKRGLYAKKPNSAIRRVKAAGRRAINAMRNAGRRATA